MAACSSLQAQAFWSQARCPFTPHGQSGSLLQNRTKAGPGHSSLWRTRRQLSLAPARPLGSDLHPSWQANGKQSSWGGAELDELCRGNVRCSMNAGRARSIDADFTCGAGNLQPLLRRKKIRRGKRVRCAAHDEGVVTPAVQGESVAEIDRAVILNTLTASSAAIADPIMSLVDTVSRLCQQFNESRLLLSVVSQPSSSFPQNCTVHCGMGSMTPYLGALAGLVGSAYVEDSTQCTFSFFDATKSCCSFQAPTTGR
jgi:hypothetical protein